MGNELVTLLIMAAYAVVHAVSWVMFEKRLDAIYRRHVVKCAPYGETGLRKVDRQMRLVVRALLVVLLLLSLGIIYFMTR